MDVFTKILLPPSYLLNDELYVFGQALLKPLNPPTALPNSFRKLLAYKRNPLTLSLTDLKDMGPSLLQDLYPLS